jgi:fumarylacetoacetate (FAA) hydrolase
MKLTTLRGAGRDGRLAVVAPDLRTAAFAPDIAPTLIDALEQWDTVEPALRELSESLRAGSVAG